MKRIRTAGASFLLTIFLVSLLTGCAEEHLRDSASSHSPNMPGDSGEKQFSYPIGPVIGTVGDADIITISDGGGCLSVVCGWPSEQIVRVVKLNLSDIGSDNWAGFKAEIYDETNLKFGFDFSRPTDVTDSTSYRGVEYDTINTFECSSVQTDSMSFTESYRFNDTSGMFDYVLNQVDRSPEASQAEMDAFSAFYSGSTLEDNPDGFKLVGLISSIAFWSTIEDYLVNEEIIDFTETRMGWTAVGSIGTIGGFFKCLVGGWMNPLCVAAVGVAIAVAATDLICRIPWVDCEIS